MDRLEDFRQMIDKIDDIELLEAGQSLLRDMITLNDLRNKADKLEASMTDGQKAIFFFFADALDSDEVIYAAERISGRKRRLERSSASPEDNKE